MTLSSQQFYAQQATLLAQLVAGTLSPSAFATAWSALGLTDNLTFPSVARMVSDVASAAQSRFLLGKVALVLPEDGLIDLGAAATHLVKIGDPDLDPSPDAIEDFGSSGDIDNPVYFCRATVDLQLVHDDELLVLPTGADAAIPAGKCFVIEFMGLTGGGAGRWHVWDLNPFGTTSGGSIITSSLIFSDADNSGLLALL